MSAREQYEPNSGGVWIAYNRDSNGVGVYRAYQTEIEALRYATSQGFLKVAYLPFGADLDVDEL